MLRSNTLCVLTWVLCLLSAGVPGPVHADEGARSLTRPFRVGERLTYDISFLNISAGTAVMEVGPGDAVGNHPSGRFITTAVSSPKVTRFFPVDNRVESLTDLTTLLPERMTFRRREGKKKEDIEYVFHRNDNTVSATRGGVTEVLPIPAETQDLISCLYYVRSLLPLKPGASQALTVYHDKKIRQIEVRVEKIELLDGPWGNLEAAQVLVIMPFQGIFLNQGNIRVWFTTDERRVPLRMKAKVVIGSIVADLVDGIPEVTRVK
ncbi:conserved exported hypothetical protein [Nitrospira lenta]|uniref:DUF3108 domain-containing protein n=1 Tax=Nitrospira lenta TaxID=1436998 RepID=A0A330L944_9BACT|nr:conserved exported hypothetical protein [Nitrospira lenta]